MSSLTLETINTVNPTYAEMLALLNLQRNSHRKEGPPSAKVRRNRLDRLKLAVLESAQELATAAANDFGQRPHAFTMSTEILGAFADFEEIRSELEEWMKPVPLNDQGTAAIQQHPLGVVGIIGAWNFPINLVIQPAVAALAAGNRVIIKMPSASAHTAEVLRGALAEKFSADEISLITGGTQVSEDFSRLPFDHILFTGSPRVGSIIQAAAAANLVPVTLELGGKNPMVIDASADLANAADQVVVSKMANGGQICLCGDYVLLDSSVKEKFIDLLKERLTHHFPPASIPAMISLIDDSAYARITAHIEDAVSKGASAYMAFEGAAVDLPDPRRRLIAPTLLLDVPEDASINEDEIFGPVLPIYTYDTRAEAIEFIASRPSPLAAYWYGDDDAAFERFCALTTSGGVTRNGGFLHAGIPGAPFGGVGRSGHGAYHGKAGFDTFTHRRPVVSAGAGGSSMGQFVGLSLISTQLRDGLAQAIESEHQRTRERLTSES
ncbi:aldehyde dehydrogenase family protein [Paenarthrobacter sp. NPDC058040]|uniref:aldehyde dehydrogenase family protein n=1 Tax=unclassified Paenarthrobacter TaxID=2634190 RepID=UPI0036DD2EB7